jgi:cell division protein FtsN
MIAMTVVDVSAFILVAALFLVFIGAVVGYTVKQYEKNLKKQQHESRKARSEREWNAAMAEQERYRKQLEEELNNG